MKVGPSPSNDSTEAGNSTQLVLKSRLPKKKARCRSAGAFAARNVNDLSLATTRVVSPPRFCVTGMPSKVARTSGGRGRRYKNKGRGSRCRRREP